MRKSLAIVAITTSLSLAGCIAPTTYHPYNGNDGFSEIQFNQRVYEIRFAGNTATSQQSVNSMLLYRSAEVTRNAGFRYFKVLSQHVNRQNQYFTTPGHSDTTVTKRGHRKYRSTTYTPPSTSVITKYTDSMRIRLLSHRAKGSRVYNARTLMNSLGPQIHWPKPNK